MNDENRSGERILIVDDEIDLVEITASYLISEGFEVSKAGNGREALALMETVVPDLIISDVSMPVMSGYELFEAVRANMRYQNVPFLFLSGHSDKQSLRQGKELGIDDYLVKPFDPGILIATIKGKLKLRQRLSSSMSLQIDQLKKQLFSLLSHEMRTPLTSILGAAEVLSDGKDSLQPEDFKSFLEMLQSGSKRLNKMVEDFLLVVRIETGELIHDMNPSESYISVREEIDKILGNYATPVTEKKIILKNTAADGSYNLRIYYPHFENILQRIADNAVKFMKTSGTILVSSKMENNRLFISIQDDGPGISRDDQGKLFQKFHQINREQTEQQGTGLGLYIAKQLCEANGCTIEVRSEEGAGAEFTLGIKILPD